MKKSKYYAGIDRFRLIAALLIIAVHTSPLADFSKTGDYILTRVIARMGVPFFFMTSGFFLICAYNRNAQKLGAFVKKTAIIYGAAILIYIPVNIYGGYFKSENLLPNIIKDIVFDGTLYHLWYMPAAIIGASVAWYLVKRLDFKRAFIVTLILYFVGLFGDSYYGISEKVGFIKGMYDLIFQVSDYTRNGIFFAPVFFVMGGYMAAGRRKIPVKKNICAFLLSFALMLAEALILRHFNMQRHDSMYIFLLPCMYFLFNIILKCKGNVKVNTDRQYMLRTLSLVIYIIHPMMIVMIRLAAKMLHLQKLFVDNAFVHYLVVCLTSVAAGVAATALWTGYRLKKQRRGHIENAARAYVEVNLKNLRHNVKVLKNAMPQGCELMAVVKTWAYGHGEYEIATFLDKIGVRAYAVATIDEGICLRKYGVRGEILILGYTDVCRVRELKKYDLMQTLISHEYANALNGQGVRVKAHIKIDTGMHRLGIPSEDTDDIKSIFHMKNIEVCGMYTHLCCADGAGPDDIEFTKRQITRFFTLTEILKGDGVELPKLHIQNSSGFLNYPDIKCDYVRAGIALYGVGSLPESRGARQNMRSELDLRPVLSLKSRVVLTRRISKGDCVGYNRDFVAMRDSRIAILSVGYGDGFLRSLSNGNGNVMINGHVAPIIGRVCMDMLAVDITDAEDVKTGDIATLIEAGDFNGLSAPDVAQNAGTISNELLCRMAERLPRFLVT